MIGTPGRVSAVKSQSTALVRANARGLPARGLDPKGEPATCRLSGATGYKPAALPLSYRGIKGALPALLSGFWLAHLGDLNRELPSRLGPRALSLS